MADGDRTDVTTILEAIARGEGSAAERLLPLVYRELHSLAAHRMANEAAGHTLQATALVHEAYLRLVGSGEQRWESRAHFFGAAAEAMRRILVEHARAKRRLKRGGDARRVDLEQAEHGVEAPDDVLSLDGAISRLEQFDPRLAEIVKLRCFVGMTIAETGEALGLSSRTVNRQWLVAKAWLKGELERVESGGE